MIQRPISPPKKINIVNRLRVDFILSSERRIHYQIHLRTRTHERRNTSRSKHTIHRSCTEIPQLTIPPSLILVPTIYPDNSHVSTYSSSLVEFLPILSYPILSYPILSYPILSYPVLSCPILYCTVLYRILSYPMHSQ
jgi:hypothetical protein